MASLRKCFLEDVEKGLWNNTEWDWQEFLAANTNQEVDEMGKYFHNTLASEKGISGDDLNRRHREQRLGFKAPDSTWAEAGKEIRCIYPDQTIIRLALDHAEIYVHCRPAWNHLYVQGFSFPTVAR